MPTKNISILGVGKIGLALATLWSHTGHSIFLAAPYSAIPDLRLTIARAELRLIKL